MKRNLLGYLLSIILVLSIGGFAGYGVGTWNAKRSMQSGFDKEVSAIKAEYQEAVRYASIKLKECTGQKIILEEKVADAIALSDKPTPVPTPSLPVRVRKKSSPQSVSTVAPKPSSEDAGNLVDYEYLETSSYSSDPVVVDYDPSADRYVFSEPVVIESEDDDDDVPIDLYGPEPSILDRGDDDLPYDIYFGGQAFLWQNGVSVGVGATWAGRKMSYNVGYLYGLGSGSPFGLTLGVSRKLNLSK